MSKASKTSDLFAGDIHASLSASLENGVAQKMTVTSGLKCLGLSKSSGPLGLLERMCLATYQWASTKCSLTWKPLTTPQGRLLFQLVPLTLHIDETESGLLHTPTAKANQMAPSMNSGWWRTPSASEGETEALQRGETKRISGHRIQMRLSDQVKMWPTPRASSAMNANVETNLKRMEKVGYETKLEQAVSTPEVLLTGSLNPAWVEWLMGFPIGHTDLNN